MQESIWNSTVALPERAPLSGNLETECVVLGGGLAGILTAYFLQERGMKTLVLEADRVGGGQTKNTTAKITAQHGLIYGRLIRQFGAEKARQYAAANQRAVADYRHIISSEHIDCQFEEKSAYLYSALEVAPLKAEAEAASALGLTASFQMSSALPFSVQGAVCLKGQAQFHPLAFLRAISQNVMVCEHTSAVSVKGNTITTNRGTVTAKHIVFATHFPFPLLPGLYFARMHQARSYVLALTGAQQVDGMYLGVDGDGLSLRNSGKLLLVGGGGHRTGENTAGGKYDLLRQKSAVLWPGSTEQAHWSAQDCMTLDGVPYIGRFANGEPNWYVATGFGKWGMTTSMVSARLISDLIVTGKSLNAPVFSPQRFTPAASAKTFLDDSLHAVVGMAHGLTAVPRCPHMGCNAVWNPDEASWDCPCHGSRFDSRGKLIDGPAQTDLESPSEQEATP